MLLLCVCFIFGQSLQPAEESTVESKCVLSMAEYILPGITEHFIRKAAHFTEFAVLGAFAGMLFAGKFKHFITGVFFAIMTGGFVALCDETIQLFVEGRSGQISDVWLDSAGAMTGALLVILALRFWRWLFE